MQSLRVADDYHTDRPDASITTARPSSSIAPEFLQWEMKRGDGGRRNPSGEEGWRGLFLLTLLRELHSGGHHLGPF